MKDIETREDIERLVDGFYAKVENDELLAPFFRGVDWKKHLPLMYSFWASIVLGEQSYSGMPFQKHLPLPLERAHFRQWLMLFHTTVDELFAGENAESIKARAIAIARVFQHKMDISLSV